MKVKIQLYDMDDVIEICDHTELTEYFLIIHYDPIGKEKRKPKLYNMAWIVSIEETDE